jgi:hypothetical protein
MLASKIMNQYTGRIVETIYPKTRQQEQGPEQTISERDRHDLQEMAAQLAEWKRKREELDKHTAKPANPQDPNSTQTQTTAAPDASSQEEFSTEPIVAVHSAPSPVATTPVGAVADPATSPVQPSTNVTFLKVSEEEHDHVPLEPKQRGSGSQTAGLTQEEQRTTSQTAQETREGSGDVKMVQPLQPETCLAKPDLVGPTKGGEGTVSSTLGESAASAPKPTYTTESGTPKGEGVAPDVQNTSGIKADVATVVLPLAPSTKQEIDLPMTAQLDEKTTEQPATLPAKNSSPNQLVQFATIAGLKQELHLQNANAQATRGAEKSIEDEDNGLHIILAAGAGLAGLFLMNWLWHKRSIGTKVPSHNVSIKSRRPDDPVII